MNYIFLKIKEFEHVGYKYFDPALLSKTAIHKRGKKKRVYYYLPDGNWCYHNTVPDLKTKREEAAYIIEFNQALSLGYLPSKGINKLRKSGYNPKDGSFSVFGEKYFNEYACKERSKGETSKSTQRSIYKRISNYFIKNGIASITDITNDDIEQWDQSLAFTPKLRGDGFISGSHRNNLRKTLRAFLNTAKEHDYHIRCNPDDMNIYEFGKGGIKDITVDARLISYPLELIDAVKKCSFKIDQYKMPDMKKIIQLWREVGLRPMEMYTLNYSNIIFKNGHPVEIKIKELKNCPNNRKGGFKPKNNPSYREVKLTDWASDFINSIVKRFEGVKRYGKVGRELIEYPFLFVFWNEKRKIFVRDDVKFRELFQNVTASAMEEFNLSYDVEFIQYDLRRSANLYFKLVMGYSTQLAAYYLGHSEFTNKKHYSLNEDQKRIAKAHAEKSLVRAAVASSEVKKNYSRQFEKEVAISEVEEKKYRDSIWQKPEIDFDTARLLSELPLIGNDLVEIDNDEDDDQLEA